MRYALLYDLVGSQSAVADHWQRTVLGLSTIDVELYSSDWKTLREILTSPDFVHDRVRAYAHDFKHRALSRIHYRWILSSAVGLMEETDDFSKVNQWIVFDSKVNFRSLDLTPACCTEYLDFERNYKSSSWPHINLVKMVAKELVGNFNITDYPFRPRHGNGATREVKRRTADYWHKNRYFTVDGEVINYLRHRTGDPHWRSYLYHPYRGLDRTSELVCVPKSMVKNRTISKEPTTLQFLQQDIMQALDDFFIENLSDRIDLHDQNKSRYLALLGSADGSYATIDLSNASDSVSVRHIEEFFDGLPIQYPLLATRSEKVHVSDRSHQINEYIRMKKFAPMGSAVCFPVECIVFAILCEAAVRLESGRRSRSFDYRVYGDDIVIKTGYSARLIMLLDEFGFTVNTEKSFSDDDSVSEHFREACGIEAMNGNDITPLRLSRRLVSITRNDADRQAGEGVGIIDLINRCYLYHYRYLRRWLNDQCRNKHWYRRLFRVSFSDYRTFISRVKEGKKPWIRLASPYVITDDLSDSQWQAWRRRAMVDSPIQRPEFLVTVCRSRKSRMNHDDNDLFSWFIDAELHPSDISDYEIDATGIVTIRPHDLKWVKTWVSSNA